MLKSTTERTTIRYITSKQKNRELYGGHAYVFLIIHLIPVVDHTWLSCSRSFVVFAVERHTQRERERHRERERERETERDTHRETERQTDRETERGLNPFPNENL